MVLFSAGLLLAAQAAGRCQWSQWRGDRRDGSTSAVARTDLWPPILERVWERDVGDGYSGPVIVGERVWVHSRRNNSEVVSCLHLATGEILWSRSYSAPFRQDHDALAHGSGPYATPAVSHGKLFTIGVTGVLSVWEAATGRLIWRKDPAAEFNPSFPYFGAAASPLVSGEVCFVHFGGHFRDRPDNQGVGAIVALNAADGQELWRYGGVLPAVGASPILSDIAGRPHLVFKTLRTIIGLDPRNGALLWTIPCKIPMDNTIVTPVIANGQLITSDYDAGISAWQIQPAGNRWTVRRSWAHRDVSLFMSSPVLVGGLLFGFSHLKKGQLFVLDPGNGTVLWLGAPRSGEHASLVAWGDEALAFMDDGSLLVGKITRQGYNASRKYRLGASGGWSHPAVTADRIAAREGRSLTVYRTGKTR
jgi:outer membrane protein assembly factor BamB